MSGPESQKTYAVLASLSERCPPLKGRLPTCYSPVRRFTDGRSHFLARLACVKRAASVDSEPGSNSRLNLLIRNRQACSLPNCLIAPVLTQVTDEFVLLRVQPDCQRSAQRNQRSQLLCKSQENQSAAGLESLFRAHSAAPGLFNLNSPGQFDHVQETWGSERTSSEGG